MASTGGDPISTIPTRLALRHDIGTRVLCYRDPFTQRLDQAGKDEKSI